MQGTINESDIQYFFGHSLGEYNGKSVPHILKI